MNIAKIRTMDISNGPGIRASIFISGCNNNCKGCFNKEAQDFNYGEKYSEELERRIFKILENEHIQGLSILGGEPLDPKNQEGVLALIVKVKEKYPLKDIWLWSGYTIDNLISREDPITTKILNEIDYIVDGPFIEELKNPGLEFRGSSNQRIINTGEYFKQRNEKLENIKERKIWNTEYVKALEKAREKILEKVPNIKISNVIDSKFSGPRAKLTYKHGSTFIYYEGTMFIVGDQYQSYSGPLNEIINYLNKNINNIEQIKDTDNTMSYLEEDEDIYTKEARKIGMIIQEKMTNEERIKLYNKYNNMTIDREEDMDKFWDWIDTLDSDDLENLEIDKKYFEEEEEDCL